MMPGPRVRSRHVVAMGLAFCFCLQPTLEAQAPPALRAQFDAIIDSAYKPGEPGGVVLISRHDTVLYERAFGLANLEWNLPMRPDAVFSIASLTKQFTAVAVLQQMEKGTLSLSDTVGRFLPDFPTAIKGITIEQLLTHTSGIANPKSNASLLALGRGWLSAAQIAAAFKDQPLEFTPGTRWMYSNSGYQLLGLIMEKVTGEPYPEFVERTLLRPAGMDHSIWGDDTRIVPNRAYPYLFTRRGLQNAVNANVQIAWAAGAIQSTAGDFLKWHNALRSGKLISRASLEKAWTPARLKDGSVTNYGYGWFLGELQGSPLVEHGGNMGGFMSHVIHLPREGLLVEVFLNGRGNRLPELAATDLAAAAIGRPLNIRPISVQEDVLRSYAGRYKDRANVDVIITLEDGKLYYQKTGGPKWALTPYAPDKLFFDNTSTVAEIQRDAEGRIIGLAMQTLRGMDRNALTRADSGH
jgi:CubicO group peptidase (beta-lactamase class C family)